MRAPILWAALFCSIPYGFCQDSGGYFPRGAGDIQAEDVSLIQLIANPTQYDHKIVRVIGFLHLEFEGNNLYLHADDYRFVILKNALWIDVPTKMTDAQKKEVQDKYVICTARFVAGMQGHMGLNSGELTDITRLQTWSFGSGRLK